MNEEDLTALFFKAARNAGSVPEEVKCVFEKLVLVTLSYRDSLKREQRVLTVEEVRTALDLFQETLRTRRLPETENPRLKDLVALWYDELKVYLR